MYLNVKTNNPTGTGTYVDVEKTAFTDIHDSSNTSSINMISSGVGVEHLADFAENTLLVVLIAKWSIPKESQKNGIHLI